jgi:hypothetical protein
VDADDAAVFAEYHRRERTRSMWLAFLIVAGGGLGLLAIGLFLSLAEPEAGAPAGIPSPSHPTVLAEPAPTTLPSPPTADVGTVAVEPSAVEPSAVEGSWSIAIAATGYQAELDACQWVRMDLGVAPIVGAHTSCGGAIVLEMIDLDAVQLAGQGLDGAYVVTGSRDARAGDTAAAATDGLAADVILQTCYPGADGRVRLVALTRLEV